MEKYANTDYTYCVSKTCKNKCWRHESNHEFNPYVNYSFMEECENARKSHENKKFL